MIYDYIVVGGGAAGCVLASRLSEDGTKHVLLLEAGADIEPEPDDIRNPYPVSVGEPAYTWPGLLAQIKAERVKGRPPTKSLYKQARIMGGGGSLMGMMALRGHPGDYDEWQRLGAEGWGWNSVLPYFRKLEQDSEGNTEDHGRSGPVPIRRYDRADWSPFARRLGAAFEADGYPFILDMNADFRDGHVTIAHSSSPERRMSSAATYLGSLVRRRPNLSIRANCEVDRILFEQGRACGVAIAGDASVLRGGTIVLAAGAIQSPALLLRSGVGPGEQLAALDVPVLSDRRGVGRNLHNHPIVYLSVVLPKADRAPGGPLTYNALRYSSGLDNCPPHDMLMPVVNRPVWHALGDLIAGVGTAVYKSCSKGLIDLERTGEGLSTRVRLGLFADERDLVRLTDGFRRLCRYAQVAGRGDWRGRVFAPTNAAMIARMARPGRRNAALARLAGAAFDGGSWLRRRAMDVAGVEPLALLGDDRTLADFVYEYATPMYHPAGSCRMGAADHPDSVVDSRCRVIGVAGLRVADASIMPTIIRGNTNIPVLMIAEKAAAMLVADDGAAHKESRT